MNWKEEAAEKLRRYDMMRTAIKTLPMEIRRLEEEGRALKAVRTDRVVSGTVSRRDEQMLNNIVCRQELEYALENARLWVQTTDHALGALSPDEKFLLHRLYIQPADDGVEQLCLQLQVEKSSIYRRREQALRKFTLALYGAESS